MSLPMAVEVSVVDEKVPVLATSDLHALYSYPLGS